MKLPVFWRESLFQIVVWRYYIAASWPVRQSKDF